MDFQTELPAPDAATLIQVPCDLCGAPPGKPFLSKFGGFYTRCPRCDFIYSNPRAADPGIHNQLNNENKSGEYIQKHYSRREQKVFSARLAEFQKYRRTGRILEIGCSAGGFLYQARQKGWLPVGIEPVEAVARHGIEKHGLDVRICFLEEAALEPDSFDVVYTNAVLEHLPSPKSALRKIREILRPGGVVLGVTVNYDSYTQRFVGEPWKLIDPRAHLSLFSPATLRQFCADAGLDVLAIRTSGVRFRPEGKARLTGALRWGEELCKLPFSIASRITLRGHNISVLARKPA